MEVQRKSGLVVVVLVLTESFGFKQYTTMSRVEDTKAGGTQISMVSTVFARQGKVSTFPETRHRKIHTLVRNPVGGQNVDHTFPSVSSKKGRQS
ncbi:hypothetical protein SLE2022_015830 [Rubroshorea leprosula]